MSESTLESGFNDNSPSQSNSNSNSQSNADGQGKDGEESAKGLVEQGFMGNEDDKVSSAESPDPTTPDVVSTEDDRSLIEKAAGWVEDKVSAKVNALLENPVTNALNFAFGFVPGFGAINAISNALGGPTFGGMAVGVARGMAGLDPGPGFSPNNVGPAVDGSNTQSPAQPADEYGTRRIKLPNGRVVSVRFKLQQPDVNLMPVDYDPFTSGNGGGS